MDTALRASLTLQDPREADTGKSPIRRAKILGAFSASRAMGPWLLGADVNLAGRRPDMDFSTWPSATPKTLGAYWLANLTARYQLNREWSLNGRIQNLLDERYQTAYGYNSMPRGVFVGLNWQR
jgi:vitamin B12 transporter